MAFQPPLVPLFPLYNLCFFLPSVFLLLLSIIQPLRVFSCQSLHTPFQRFHVVVFISIFVVLNMFTFLSISIYFSNISGTIPYMKQHVRYLILYGLRPPEIADYLGVSRPYVYNLLRKSYAS